MIGSSIIQRFKTRGLHVNVKAGISHTRKILQQYGVSSLENIIIQLGGNDVSNQRDIEAIDNDFSEMITDLRRTNSNIHVYILEVMPRKDAMVTDMNETIRVVWEEYGDTLIKSSTIV